MLRFDYKRGGGGGGEEKHVGNGVYKIVVNSFHIVEYEETLLWIGDADTPKLK